MTPSDLVHLDQLARSAADGDVAAARELGERIRLALPQVIASSVRRSEAIRHARQDVNVDAVLSAFEKPETLRDYVAWSSHPRNRRKSFADWLSMAAAEAIDDHMARRAAEGDRSALKDLIARLHEPWVTSIRSSWRLRESVDQEDDARNIALRLIGKFEEPSTLKSYVSWRARHVNKHFRDWMNIVVVNTTRSYVKPSRNSIRNLIQMNAQPAQGSIRPPFTDGYCAAQLKNAAGELLDVDQLAALNIWLEGGSFDDIATEAACSVSQAQRHVRAAIAKLRRKFLNGDGA
ncbi:MAG TPA: hypothetical protein VIV60_23960 [Polyangiaceae bacterium]